MIEIIETVHLIKFYSGDGRKYPEVSVLIISISESLLCTLQDF